MKFLMIKGEPPATNGSPWIGVIAVLMGLAILAMGLFVIASAMGYVPTNLSAPKWILALVGILFCCGGAWISLSQIRGPLTLALAKGFGIIGAISFVVVWNAFAFLPVGQRYSAAIGFGPIGFLFSGAEAERFVVPQVRMLVGAIDVLIVLWLIVRARRVLTSRDD